MGRTNYAEIQKAFTLRDQSTNNETVEVLDYEFDESDDE